jgi:hypothetical protein
MFPFLLLHHAPAMNIGILWIVVAINGKQSHAILLPPLVAWYKFRNHYARWRGRLSRPRSDTQLPSHTPGFQPRLIPISVYAAKSVGGCSNYLCECPKRSRAGRSSHQARESAFSGVRGGRWRSRGTYVTCAGMTRLMVRRWLVLRTFRTVSPAAR